MLRRRMDVRVDQHRMRAERDLMERLQAKREQEIRIGKALASLPQPSVAKECLMSLTVGTLTETQLAHLVEAAEQLAYGRAPLSRSARHLSDPSANLLTVLQDVPQLPLRLHTLIVLRRFNEAFAAFSAKSDIVERSLREISVALPTLKALSQTTMVVLREMGDHLGVQHGVTSGEGAARLPLVWELSPILDASVGRKNRPLAYYMVRPFV